MQVVPHLLLLLLLLILLLMMFVRLCLRLLEGLSHSSVAYFPDQPVNSLFEHRLIVEVGTEELIIQPL